jgi:hypothetical protein
MKRIDVFLRTTSQAYHAYPDNKDQISHVINTLTKRVFTEEGKLCDVPYFPGNGLRGRFRRVAGKVVMDHLIKSEGGYIPEKLYLGLMSGSSVNQPDGASNSIAEIFAVHEDAYMGLFGGGARMLESGYRVSDINPVLASTVSAGLVPDGVFRVPTTGKDNRECTTAWDVTELVTQIHCNDILDPCDDPAGALRYVSEDDVQEHYRLVGEERGSDSKHHNIKNMMAYRVIATGVPFHFSITIADHVTNAQVGLLIECLKGFVQSGSGLGGMGRAGWGCFKVHSVTLSDNGEKYSLYDEGGASVDSKTAELLETFSEAMKKSISEMTLAKTAGFFENRDPDKTPEGRAEKAAKKAETAAAKAAAKKQEA